MSFERPFLLEHDAIQKTYTHSEDRSRASHSLGVSASSFTSHGTLGLEKSSVHDYHGEDLHGADENSLSAVDGNPWMEEPRSELEEPISHDYYGESLYAPYEKGLSSVVGEPGMPEPAAKPKGPKIIFRPEDDALLSQLKETKNLTWRQISDFFPGRSPGTLQVRYYTRLKAETVGDGMTTAEQLLVFDIVSAALCEQELLAINLAALSDIDIGVERFHQEVQRLIKVFGQDVNSPEQTSIAQRVARTLQLNRSSAYIAQLIERQTRASVHARSTGKTLRVPLPQTGTTTGNTGGNDEAKALWAHDLLLTKSVFLNSNAFCAYRSELLLFVHRPYQARISRSMGLASKVIDDSGRVLNPEQVARMAQEISWTPTALLIWSDDKSLPAVEHLKGLVEESMGETWNWWPLRSRLHRLQDGFCRLYRQTPHKTCRHLDVSEDARAAIQNATRTAPAFLSTMGLSDVLLRPANGDSSIPAATAPPFSGTPSRERYANSPSGGPPLPLQPIGNPVPDASHVRQPIVPPAPIASIATSDVHLCIEAGLRQFTALDCKDLRTDVEFFDSIKSQYNKARGWYRLWFSTWTYDYCDFYLFQKHGINSSARLRVGFPDATDPSYDFSPRPPEYLPPDGPISHDEFNFHYYHDLCPSYISWKRWFATSYFTNTGPSTASRTALDAVLKRTSELKQEDGRRELFYGLYAKEARSAFRVLMYMSLCNVPSVIFFFLWLYQWGHGSDLQGAAVLVNLSLSLTMGFLGWLYWTR